MTTCYKYIIKRKGHPLHVLTVSDIICDKLSMTIELDEPMMKETCDILKDLGAKPHKSYYFSYPLYFEEYDHSFDTTILVQAGLKKTNKHIVRLELNPARFDNFSEATAYLMNAVFPYELSWEALVDVAKVTRIDLAVDIANCQIDNLLFRYPQISYSKIINKSGKTVQLGANAGSKVIKIYDKVEEIKAKNLKKIPEIKTEVPDHSLTRIEIVLRSNALPKPYHRLKDCYDINNPFTNLTVTSFEHLEHNDDDLWNQTLCVARHEGLQKALLNIKSFKIRKKFTDRAKAGGVNWWKPERLWSESYKKLIDHLISPPYIPGPFVLKDP